MIVTMPAELKAAFTFFITQGIKALLHLFGKDISGKTSAFVAAAVAAILFFIDSVLAAVPPENVEVVQSGLDFLALALAAFGTHYAYKHVGRG